MKSLKRIVCLLAIASLILPMCIFTSSADIIGWDSMAAKYSSNTHLIITKKDGEGNKTIKEEGFSFINDERGEISVRVPDYNTFSGAFPVSLLTSSVTTPLEGLTITIAPDEFEFGMYDYFSVLWTEAPIEKLADPETETGLYDAYKAYANGLRNVMPEGYRGLCISVGNSKPGNCGSMTASDVKIVYYDGVTKDQYGNLGELWGYTSDNPSNIMPLPEYPIQTQYENIDLTFGLTVTVRADKDSGYIVNINGKDYGGISEKLYPYLDVKLNGLTPVKKGYVSVGMTTHNERDNERPKNYTFKSINGYTPIEWANQDFPVCPHMFEEHKTEAGCNTEGRIDSTCVFCEYTFSKIIPAKGHSFTDWQIEGEVREDGLVTETRSCEECGYTESRSVLFCEHSYESKMIREESCMEAGIIEYKCSFCGYSYTEMVESLPTPHTPGKQWVIVNKPDYDHGGLKGRICTLCGKACILLPIEPLIRFEDVDYDSWYAEGLEYCQMFEMILGTSSKSFEPEGTLTREQLVTILARMASADIYDYKGSAFDDVSEKSWYSGAVNWAYEKGIVQGVAEGRFGTGRAVTREELATILYRFADAENVNSEALERFSDKSRVSDWALEAVCWAADAEILGSTSVNDSIIAPKMTVTRAQIVKIFMSFHRIANK